MKKTKVFLLITVLITFIMVASFSVLYFVLPQVYHYSKNHAINRNANLLTENLSSASSITECMDLISKFSTENNAVVFAHDKNGEIVSELSTISLMMGEGMIQFRANNVIIANTTTDTIADPAEHAQRDISLIRREGSGQVLYFGRNNENVLFIARNIESELIDSISITSMFQPITEARYVVLILSPFLLLLGIVLGLIAAFFYLKREEQYAQNKTDFMRATHHELKTPIAALSGIIDGMIDNVGVYKDRDEYLPKAKESLERLTLLTNDVLNATQAMDHKMPKEKIDIGKLLNESIEHYEPLISEKTLVFDPFSFIYKTNRIMLKTAISNLMSNAIKYTTGEIKITFENNTLSIENECEQIAEDDLQKIFEPFYTLSQSRSREQSGNGIGLYIVRRNLDALKLKHAMRNTTNGIVFEIFF